MMDAKPNNSGASFYSFNELFAYASSNQKESLYPYEIFKEKYQERKFFLSWNWPVFFFGPFWFWFRRMYIEGILYSLGVFAILNCIRYILNLSTCLDAFNIHYIDMGFIFSFSSVYSGFISIGDFISIVMIYASVASMANWYYGCKLFKIVQDGHFTKKEFYNGWLILVGICATFLIGILLQIFFKIVFHANLA
jgi:hypothetical protein